MSKHTLKSDEHTKISLRPIQPSDIDDFMVWASDGRVSKYCTWDPYTSRDEAMDFLLNKCITHPWYRVICLDNRAIGSIFVWPSSGGGSSRAELGYVLSHDHWGKGIATQAVKKVVSIIFEEWPHLVRLEAFVIDENKGSLRVLEKAGFVKEGLLRKHTIIKGECRNFVLFSILSSERHLVDE